MSNSRYALLKLVLGPALLFTLMPSGCAVGVAPEFEDEPRSDAGTSSQAGGGNGGGAGKPSGASGSGTPSTAGTTSASGSGANPFGGSAGSGGQAGQGGKGGSASGSTNGGAGSAGRGGSAGAGGGGGTSGGCTCAKTLPWTDNTVMNWATGDCVTTGGVTYRYVGTKAQTYANGDCNPAMQEPWCSDSGNDYKFMACP
jgi:hypothetical protein